MEKTRPHRKQERLSLFVQRDENLTVFELILSLGAGSRFEVAAAAARESATDPTRRRHVREIVERNPWTFHLLRYRRAVKQYVREYRARELQNGKQASTSLPMVLAVLDTIEEFCTTTREPGGGFASRSPGNKNGPHQHCAASYQEIADELGVTERSVLLVIKLLRAGGFLAVEPRTDPHGRQVTNTLTICHESYPMPNEWVRIYEIEVPRHRRWERTFETASRAEFAPTMVPPVVPPGRSILHPPQGGIAEGGEVYFREGGELYFTPTAADSRLASVGGGELYFTPSIEDGKTFRKGKRILKDQPPTVEDDRSTVLCARVRVPMVQSDDREPAAAAPFFSCRNEEDGDGASQESTPAIRSTRRLPPAAAGEHPPGAEGTWQEAAMAKQEAPGMGMVEVALLSPLPPNGSQPAGPPAPLDPAGAARWQRALDQLRGRCSEANYGAWVATLVPIEMDDGRAVLGCLSLHHQQSLLSRGLCGTLRDVLGEVTFILVTGDDDGTTDRDC